MVIALAGRRIDGPDARPPRFPADAIDRVSHALQDLFRTTGAKALVSSAACGADLIALVEAGKAGMRRRVVLPFERQRFRESSVVDRPGSWGPMFDQVIDDVTARGDLVILSSASGGDAAYAAANQAILDEAEGIARSSGQPLCVALLWDGRPRGADDLTAAFGEEARRRDLRVIELLTRP